MSSEENIFEDKSIFEELSDERKQLQSEGKLPEWFTTQGWQMFKGKYLYGCNTFEEQITRIVDKVGEYAPTKAEYFKKRWKEDFMGGIAYLATPPLSNTGTDRGLSVSCSGSVIGDSIDSFYGSLHEAALLSKNGFGTSAYFGGIRPRGTPISGGGTAEGSLPVFEDYVTMARKVSQGAARRGAFAGYLPVNHGDFWEWAQYLKDEPAGVNVGWNWYDKDIKALGKGDDPEILARYQRTSLIKCTTGRGYIYKPDTVARQAPQMYKDLGLSSKASNLCVAPETQVLTDVGHVPIADLEGQEVNVWNGEEFTSTVVRKTGENQALVKVVTNSGYEVECTPYHKFYVAEGYTGRYTEKRASELVSGDKLIKYSLPIIQGEKVLDKAYTNGFYSADGCCSGGKQLVLLYHGKQKLEQYMEGVHNSYHYKDGLRTTLTCKGLRDKFFVPDATYDIHSRLSWLAGYMDGDGSIYHNGTNQQLVGCSIEFEFLREMQLMLQTLGVESKIQIMSEEGMRSLPKNDGSGEMQDYFCQKAWRIIVNSNGLFKLHELGVDFKRLETVKRFPQRSASHFITVVEVVDEGRSDDTYCFTEKKRNMGVFGGLLAGNCVEIALHADEEHTYTCVIGGLVASQYRKWEHTDSVYCQTVFLDCLVSLFLDEAKDIKGLDKAINGTKKGRAIGVGLTGLHSLFQKENLPFGNFQAHMLSTEIAIKLKEDSLEASQWMAKEWGEPEWCKGYGVRNTHRTAYAPNVTSSLIFRSESQGINPWYGNAYIEGSAAGGMLRINPAFVDLLKKYGKYNDEMIQYVVQNQGSCLGLDFLTDHEKEVFKTAFEIAQEDIINMASARQRHNCQGQSLNNFFDADEKEEYISSITQKILEDEYLTGAYYQRGKAGVQASTGGCSNCES